MANYNKLSTKPINEIIVAKRGGDERRIQKALDSAKAIAAASDGDTAPITVKVYPGTYTEDSGLVTVYDNTILYGVVQGAVIVDANILVKSGGQIYNILQPDTHTYTEE